MADYTKETWVNDDGSGTMGTLFTAARMNNIENGVKDAAEHNQRGTLAGRPAAGSGNKNWLYMAYDDRGGTLYYSDGSSWYEVSKPGLSDIFCRLATTAALASHSRSGNVLTASANGALSVDGTTPSVGDYVLVKNEGSGSHLENGPYSVTTVGAAGAAWVLTRVPEFDSSDKAKAGRKVRVNEGAVNADTEWTLLTNDAITLNTTALRWGEHDVPVGLPYGGSGWADYGAPYPAATYYKKDGRVFLDGATKRASGSSTTIATLPAGFRPAGSVVHPISGFGVVEALSITSAGVISGGASAGSQAVTWLDGYNFVAA